MMIYTEEQLFKDSFGSAIGLVKPVAPLEEDFATPEEFQIAREQHLIDMEDFTVERDSSIRASIETGEMPDIAGTADNSCLKTSSNIIRKNAIIYQGKIINSSVDNFAYVADLQNTVIDIDKLGL